MARIDWLPVRASLLLVCMAASAAAQAPHLVDVPGSDAFDTKNVPHGSVAEVHYFVLNNTVATVEFFRKHGFALVYKESAGGHTWLNWRDYLNAFAPQLFQ